MSAPAAKDFDQPLGAVAARLNVSGAHPEELLFFTVTTNRVELPYSVATEVGEAVTVGADCVQGKAP